MSDSDVLRVIRERTPMESCRVLIGDADPLAVRIYSACLQRIGVSMTATDAWDSMMQELRSGQFVVVLLSWELVPHSMTMTALRRAHRGYVYLIATVHQASKDRMAEALRSGCDDVLLKPFMADVLMHRIQVAQRISLLERDLCRRNAELELAQERHRSEITAAAVLQRSMIPTLDQVSIPGIEVVASWIPCEGLGGDMIGVEDLGHGQLLAWMLDVSGHGLVAALRAVQVASALVDRSGGLLRADDGSPRRPHAILEGLDHRFPMDPRVRQFFTIAVALIDVHAGEAEIALAGHPRPMLLESRGEVVEVEVNGPAVGWNRRPRSDGVRIPFHPGSTILIFSDGIVEATDGATEAYGDHRLAQTFGKRGRNPTEFVAGLESELERWTHGRREDDQTVLVIRRTD